MSKESKRNAKGAGLNRKRPDGRWEGRYTLGYDPKTGKQQQKYVYATASFTLDIYGHASQKMRQQSADRMEQFIKTVISD